MARDGTLLRPKRHLSSCLHAHTTHQLWLCGIVHIRSYALALAFGTKGNVTARVALPEFLVSGAPTGLSSALAVSARATLLDGAHADCAVRPVGAGSGLVDIIVPLTSDGCAVVALEVRTLRVGQL